MMDVLEAIRTRRMLPRVGEERPSRADIEELLELAVRAPNHHRTEPWRFHVLAGGALDSLANAMAEAGGEVTDETLADARKKVARAPVIVVFTTEPSEDPKVFVQEEHASVAMAMQNFLLGAHAKGLGAMLRTGGVAYHPSINKHLGLGPREVVAGLIYLGIPIADRPLQERAPASEKTTWHGWD